MSISNSIRQFRLQIANHLNDMVETGFIRTHHTVGQFIDKLRQEKLPLENITEIVIDVLPQHEFVNFGNYVIVRRDKIDIASISLDEPEQIRMFITYNLADLRILLMEYLDWDSSR
jgi:hypothetical protein